jgi:hypothetical protein
VADDQRQRADLVIFRAKRQNIGELSEPAAFLASFFIASGIRQFDFQPLFGLTEFWLVPNADWRFPISIWQAARKPAIDRPLYLVAAPSCYIF